MTTLYLVDDHQIMRDGLRALLEARGHTVVGESAEPTQALADLIRLASRRVAARSEPGRALGAGAAGRGAAARGCRFARVVLTMSAQPHQVAEALRLGASAYVLKGSPASELMTAIDAAVKGKRFLGADVADLALEAFVAARR